MAFSLWFTGMLALLLLLALWRVWPDRPTQGLTQALSQVESQLHRLEQHGHTTDGQLTARLEMLAQTHAQLRQETQQMLQAFRTPHVAGQWGELSLRRLVELAGLVEHCDFEVHPSLPHEPNALRPDLVVCLPQGRRIFVDAKAVLAAFLEAAQATDEATRQAALRAHAAQVRKRMEALSAKAYWRAHPQSPEYVVLFLPGEPFLSAALSQDPTLLEDAFQRHIILATPSTLVALLRTVAAVWGEQQGQERAQEITAVGRQFADQLAGTYEALRQVGQSLHAAVSAYNHVVTRMETHVGPLATRLATAGVGPVRTSASPKPVLTQPRPVAGAAQAAPTASASIDHPPTTSKPRNPSEPTRAGRSQPSV